ncbi:RNA-binding protein 25-like [Cocos nucifera]|uniref:RNA-binding protein 25-like n=1 Tax=Cocos nucifera TaxID=13894 RepID=A0A8K0IPA5_COCNU|nr:RNA-binding protein 25-like [Cocos nucifera]
MVVSLSHRRTRPRDKTSNCFPLSEIIRESILPASPGSFFRAPLMAVGSPSSPESQAPKPDKSEPENPPAAPQDPSSLPPPSSTRASAAAAENPSPNPLPNSNPNPNLNPNAAVVISSPPSVPAFAPSFRPLGAPPVPQYSIPIPSFQGPMAQNPSVQPPGVSAPVPIMLPGAASGAGAVTASVSSMPPVFAYQVPPGQLPHSSPVPYGQVPNGYMGVPAPSPQAPAAIPPPGVPRYPAPYPTMIHPGFPPRPIRPIGVISQLPRAPVPGIRGVPPIVTPVVRPVAPVVAPTEKPQTTVYVGKIALTVDDEFLLSLLRLCGPVKSWKRAQDPSNGTPKGFGFCEFESAKGVLRALRLLSNLNIDGQELVLKVDQATRGYLELYVEKKTVREKLKETEAGAADKESESAGGVEKQEPPKPVAEEKGKDSEDSRAKENQENIRKFGIVTDEDHQADRDALEKLTNMIEERLNSKPLPPPPSPAMTPADDSAKSNSEGLSKSRDGYSDMGIMKRDAAEDKNDDETTSEKKPATDYYKHETGSPDKSRKHDSKIKRERDLKWEKERELDRYEQERERERVRRERERELKLREAERLYKERLKEWEAREKKKEYQRWYDKEREKGREWERHKEILNQEDDSDDEHDDSRKRRRRGSTHEEKRRKRRMEKEEDLADRLKEEEEIAEAKRRAIEKQPPKDDMEPPTDMITENEKPVMQEGKTVEGTQISPDQACESVSGNGDTPGDGIYRNSSGDELTMGLAAATDMKQTNNAPTRKLGFGLIGSGKRTTVLSVFHEEDDEDVDEKKMRPLVPLDYSTEELQDVQTNASRVPANLVASAELKKAEMKKEISRRSNDRFSQRERDRNSDKSTRGKDESKEKMPDWERVREDNLKTENKKLLDAKQLIDMIPKTKEELFVYEINWDIYDKHELHERMRPWISKKINEFLGEEEVTLVDYIVSCIRDHMQALKLLELLSSILDDEAEMFVLKMWRMLIFEIKRVETGLQVKPRV